MRVGIGTVMVYCKCKKKANRMKESEAGRDDSDKWEKMDTFKEKKQEELCQVKGPWKQNNKYSECQDLVF